MTTVRVPAPFAQAGTVTPIDLTRTDGVVNFNQGYTDDYSRELGVDPAAKAVERDKLNYMLNLITTNLIDWQQSAFPQWLSANAYAINAFVRYTATAGTTERVYRCIAASSAGVLPTNTTFWEELLTVAQILASVPMPENGVVTVATDFNTLVNGTWEFASNTIANGSPNAPAQLGTSSLAGMLQSKQWTSGANTFIVQQYTDTSGNTFYRGATNGSFTAWRSGFVVDTFSIDTGGANAVSGAALLASTVITNGTRFLVQIAANNTGATTYRPNASISALPVVGMDGGALQGGELAAGGKALFTYNSAVPNWTLNYCSGAAQTGAKATKPNQLVELVQVPMPDQGVLAVATDFNTLTNGTWEIAPDSVVAASVNKPSVVTGATAVSGKLESRQWLSGTDTIGTQDFVDRNGNTWARGSLNGVFSAWQQALAVGTIPGRWLGRRIFTTLGLTTYVATAGTGQIDVLVVGAGGGGGGAAPTTAGGVVSAGSGGGAGGWSRKRYTSAFNGANIFVGGGGAGVSGGAGGLGSTSSFGAQTGTGGNGGSLGSAQAPSNQPVGGSGGGSGGGGDIAGQGGIGVYAIYNATPVSGAGGTSIIGAGAFPVSGTSGGNVAVSLGSGGSGGALSNGSSSGAGGGAGAPGVVIIDEYT